MITGIAVVAMVLSAYAVYRVLASRGESAPPAPTLLQGVAGSGDSEGEYDVVLRDCGPYKIRAIKAVRQITNMGLADAKHFVERPNATFAHVNAGVAERIKALLEAAGASVEILQPARTDRT